MGRLTAAEAAVTEAAHAAARLGSAVRDPAAARGQATTEADRVLGEQGIACAELTVTVDVPVTPIGQPSTATARVRCAVRWADLALPGLPGPPRRQRRIHQLDRPLPGTTMTLATTPLATTGPPATATPAGQLTAALRDTRGGGAVAVPTAILALVVAVLSGLTVDGVRAASSHRLRGRDRRRSRPRRRPSHRHGRPRTRQPADRSGSGGSRGPLLPGRGTRRGHRGGRRSHDHGVGHPHPARPCCSAWSDGRRSPATVSPRPSSSRSVRHEIHSR